MKKYRLPISLSFNFGSPGLNRFDKLRVNLMPFVLWNDRHAIGNNRPVEHIELLGALPSIRVLDTQPDVERLKPML